MSEGPAHREICYMTTVKFSEHKTSVIEKQIPIVTRNTIRLQCEVLTTNTFVGAQDPSAWLNHQNLGGNVGEKH